MSSQSAPIHNRAQYDSQIVLQAAREGQPTRPPRHVGELKDVVVQDERGAELRLGDLWREQPAVLVFLRHYGCVFCRAHAVQLHRAR